MRTFPSRYAAWCRRQGTAQCNPAVIGFGLVVVTCLVAGIKISQELAVHWTGLMQLVAGTGAALACLAAAVLVIGAMRLVERTPVPVNPAIQPAPARQSAVVTAMTLRPEERAEMEAEAELLASGDTALVVSGAGAVYGLANVPGEAL